MKCEIIKDLLPLYCDGLVSDVTREEVEKHLESCNDCRDVCKHMKEAVPEVPKPDIQPMKKIIISWPRLPKHWMRKVISRETT